MTDGTWFERRKAAKKAEKQRKRWAPMEAPFVEPMGVPYLEFLAHIHAVKQPEWYLEIGTQKGRSLRPATCHCIAIDPEFMLEAPVMGGKKSLQMVQDTSDAFFESGYLARNNVSLDFAFLDGMHLFEFLLRDFIGTEAASRPDGMIAMHDCVPRNHIMAERDWDKEVTKHWAGDVWKLLPILSRYRPDLTLTVWDCPPTSLVCVTGLDPQSNVLSDNMAAILDEFTKLSLEAYGAEKFVSEVKFADSRAALDAGRALP